jgi:competence ComEA-like helix-hairpin-helix protein
VEWGKWVLGYFDLTRRERIAVIILALLVLFIFLLPRFLSSPGISRGSQDTAWVAKLRELELKQDKEEKVRKREPEDHLYTYQYDRPAYKPFPERRLYFDTNASTRFNHSKKTFRYEIVDINLADTTAFIALPGIGSKLASRIINFREKLGGFYSVQQIAEVYGLADSVFQKISPYLQLKDSTVKKININTATIDELKAHPYIRYNIAKAIVAYRNEHGPFLKLADIKSIMIIGETLFIQVEPYLTLE